MKFLTSGENMLYGRLYRVKWKRI